MEQVSWFAPEPIAPDRTEEFYETPRWQVEALLKRIGLRPDARVVEPCAGNGAIARVLSDHRLYLWTNDVVAREYRLGSCGDATLRETWERFKFEVGAIDAVITNLPFSKALPILELAIEFSPFVASILRRTWDEPTNERGPWLAQHHCTGQIVLPRHSYTGNGHGDQATTAWFIWERDIVSRLQQPFDVVTKEERDEFIAQYGAR